MSDSQRESTTAPQSRLPGDWAGQTELFARAFRICPGAFGISRLDDGVIVEVNDGFSEITGYSRAEAVGRSAAALGIWSDPAQRDEVYARLRAGSAVRDFDFGFRTRAGEQRYGVLSAETMAVGGERLLLWLWRDTTVARRVESEHERLVRRLEAERGFLQEVLRQMQKGVIIAEAPSGRIIMGNDQLERIWGQPFDPAGAQFSGLHADGSRYRAEEWPLARALAEGEAVNDEEIGFLRPDGSRGMLIVSAAPVRDSSGHIVAGIETFYDISELKRTENQLKRYTHRLEVLHELDQAIIATRSAEEIASSGLEHMRQLLLCRAAEVLIFAPDGPHAELLASSGDLPAAPPPGTPVALDGFSFSADYQRGKALLVGADEAAAVPSALAGAVSDLGACASIPLLAGAELIGALNVWSGRPDSFEPPYLEVAREVANELAIAVHKSRLFEQLEAAHERLQQLSRRLLEAQEQERRYLARELHDQIGQVLTAVQINLAMLQRQPAAAPLAERLGDSVDLVERALEQVRSLSLDLRPSLLDDLGLKVALNWYSERVAARSGLAISIDVDGVAERLPDDLETAIFRIVQEALTNVIRHAQARQVRVTLQLRAGQAELAVVDDGCGFNSAARGGASLGVLGMAERAELVGGRLEIESAPGAGTTVRASFPLGERA